MSRKGWKIKKIKIFKNVSILSEYHTVDFVLKILVLKLDILSIELYEL